MSSELTEKDMKTLGTFVLVRPAEKKASIVDPGTAFQMTAKQQSALNFQEGAIHDVGDAIFDSKLKPGVRILYKYGKGHDVVISGETYRALDYRDLAIILEDTEEV